MNLARTTRTARTLLASIASISLLTTATSSAGAAEPRPFGDARILAEVPTPPGFPEGIAVRGNRVYVAGPATFGTAGKPPSKVVAFDVDTGAEVRTYDAQGENLLLEHANSSIAFDGSGKLYVLNTQLGMYRLDPAKGTQETYSKPFPDLKPCGPLPVPPCSPTLTDAPALPNDLAFDDAGNAYVTDSMQATIWRVQPGVADPEVWFQDQRLASAYIGVNGIRLDATRTYAYITVSADLYGGAFVYRLPLANPSAATLKVFHQYDAGEVPDGVAFGQSGLLYVAMATPFSSGVSILDSNGTEVVRLGNPLGSPVHPYDSPANIAFTKKGSILLTNHAFVTGVVDPEQFTVVDVYVGDKGSPLAQPILP